METVNNVVNAASKAIWGEQNPQTTTGNETAGQEPVSGMQGKGNADSPFDQGNAGKWKPVWAILQICTLAGSGTAMRNIH
jgi:hypothetical protein